MLSLAGTLVSLDVSGLSLRGIQPGRLGGQDGYFVWVNSWSDLAAPAVGHFVDASESGNLVAVGEDVAYAVRSGIGAIDGASFGWD
jgi:hypothetical protein